MEKTLLAEKDLIDIWRYTADKWGEAQADNYLHKIQKCFEKIATGKVALRNLASDIKYIRCEHHFIFLLTESKPIIIAVLHEKMDALARIKDRLE